MGRLYLGDTRVRKAYLGDTRIRRMYLGTERINLLAGISNVQFAGLTADHAVSRRTTF